MIILRTIDEVSRYVAEQRQRGASIGLVPTMGALHAGHISLVEKCVSENDVTIVSVFVNPTQFNNPADLASYPGRRMMISVFFPQRGLLPYLLPEWKRFTRGA